MLSHATEDCYSPLVIITSANEVQGETTVGESIHYKTARQLAREGKVIYKLPNHETVEGRLETLDLNQRDFVSGEIDPRTHPLAYDLISRNPGRALELLGELGVDGLEDILRNGS